MIVIDSNVFVIDLRYPRDRLHATNKAFLRWIASTGEGATTLVNLLEVVGILSFNLNPRQTRTLFAQLPRRYAVRVVPAADLGTELPGPRLARLLEIIEKRCSFGDALVLDQVERFAPPGSVLASWDASHLGGKTALEVRTPRELLESPSS